MFRAYPKAPSEPLEEMATRTWHLLYDQEGCTKSSSYRGSIQFMSRQLRSLHGAQVEESDAMQELIKKTVDSERKPTTAVEDQVTKT